MFERIISSTLLTRVAEVLSHSQEEAKVTPRVDQPEDAMETEAVVPDASF